MAYQIEPEKCYFITLTVSEWVDVFTRPQYQKVVLDSLTWCHHHKGLRIYAYVLMSNHLHTVVQVERGNLSSVLRDFKKYTSQQILRDIKKRTDTYGRWMLDILSRAAQGKKSKQAYQFWIPDNSARECWDSHFTRQKIQYIHYNPVRAGLVEKPEDYRLSSASVYQGGANYTGVPVSSTITGEVREEVEEYCAV